MTVLVPLSENTIEKDIVTISVYTPENKSQWANFIAKSKNGTFLFYRDYMDYHSDRFKDHSLMFLQKGKLIALLPANVHEGVLYSHEGLTFGGVISNYSMSTNLMLKIFEKIKEHCLSQGIYKIIYKPIPAIYHSAPSDEDLYALFRSAAKLIGRNAASCIYLPEKRKFDTKRREAIKKAQKNSLIVKQSYDFEAFMRLVEQVVNERHGARPVHTSGEMCLLASRFPSNIKLFASYRDDVMLAGCLIYESKNVAHGQYAANSNEGRALGAQDIIINYLINDYYKDKKYFEFGISTLDHGRILNDGLIAHKESFDASTIVYDLYEMAIQ
ncbi:GNAT family N-acetyltransferase [Candidatus Bathyarchaeota archaeon]|nr:GNAT family N-acetyltransferase [Candidatus Bathyarchaeota archaeon]